MQRYIFLGKMVLLFYFFPNTFGGLLGEIDGCGIVDKFLQKKGANSFAPYILLLETELPVLVFVGFGVGNRFDNIPMFGDFAVFYTEKVVERIVNASEMPFAND